MEVKFKKVGGMKRYVKYAELKKGEVIVTGKYIGRTPNKFGKENYEFLPDDGGPITCLNHSGQLGYLIDSYLEEGDTCRVTYAGKNVLESGAFKGKEAHTFELETAEQDNKTQKVNAPVTKETDTVDLSDLD